jgi:hypothetical protein
LSSLPTASHLGPLRRRQLPSSLHLEHHLLEKDLYQVVLHRLVELAGLPRTWNTAVLHWTVRGLSAIVDFPMINAAATRVSVRHHPPKAHSNAPAFNVKSFLDPTDLGRRVSTFQGKETVFSQGDPAKSVMYIQEGSVKLTVVNASGKEAVVGILGPGDFLGEGCLAGQPKCMATATTVAPTSILVIEKEEMIRVLHTEHAFLTAFCLTCLHEASESKRT